MQQNCYRCGLLIEEQLAFCSSCGAPQIRVSRAPESEQPSEAPDQPASGVAAGQNSSLPASPADLARDMAGIDWKQFLRTAAPLAGLIGVLTIAVRPVGLFLLLPLGVIWTVARYRKHRPLPLRAGQGARMGAFMAFLSFASFLVLFLIDFFLSPARYRELMVSNVHEVAARNPDPQVQQMLQRFATPEGLVAFMALFLATVLVVFLIVGMSSGALAVALGNVRNRP